MSSCLSKVLTINTERVNITFDDLSNDISHFVVAQNFIISSCLSKVLTINTEMVNFLENANRYKVQIFSVNITFNGLSNDISHFVVAQNFVMSSCLSKVLTINTERVNFLENVKRYKVEIFSVH